MPDGFRDAVLSLVRITLGRSERPRREGDQTSTDPTQLKEEEM
jgi:hypothetical protein